VVSEIAHIAVVITYQMEHWCCSKLLFLNIFC